jgi:hypothetical protein
MLGVSSLSETHAGTIATSMLTTHVNMACQHGLASNDSVAFSLQSSNMLNDSICSIGTQNLSTNNSLDLRLKAQYIRPVVGTGLRKKLR